MSSAKLRQELLNDPKARGYAGMTAIQVLADLAISHQSLPDRTTITREEFYTLVVRAEFSGLSVEDKARVRDIYELGTIDISDNSKARAELMAIFTATGAGTTRKAFNDFVTGRTQSTRAFLGLRSALLRESAIEACRLPSQPDTPFPSTIGA